MTTIGVLALQGDFAEHLLALTRIGAEVREVRTPRDLDGVDGLIIPGGESTTIGCLMERCGLRAAIGSMAEEGTPIWGTCAGLILLARHIVGSDQPRLGVLDVEVLRNGYGRQVDSFEAEAEIPVLGEAAFHAIFIRAPVIHRTGPGVQVLARLPAGTPIAVQEGNLLGTTFHPELTPDPRFHAYFLGLAREHKIASNVPAH